MKENQKQSLWAVGLGMGSGERLDQLKDQMMTHRPSEEIYALTLEKWSANEWLQKSSYMTKFGFEENSFRWDVESGLEEATSESGRLPVIVLSEKKQ